MNPNSTQAARSPTGRLRHLDDHVAQVEFDQFSATPVQVDAVCGAKEKQIDIQFFRTPFRERERERESLTRRFVVAVETVDFGDVHLNVKKRSTNGN